MRFKSAFKGLMIRYRWNVTYTGANRSTYIDLTENLEEKGSLGRNRCRWENNIRIPLEQDGTRMGTFPGSLKRGNKPSVFIKRENWFD
jgi:hypothetical protein